MTTRTESMDAARPVRAPSQETVTQAIEWRIRLQSGRAGDADLKAWQRWLDTSPEHAEAWARLEAIDGQVMRLPSRLAHAALERNGHGRRRALLALGACSAGLVLLQGSRTQAWQSRIADYQTAIGERQQIRLEDGTVVDMNTNTAFNFRQADGQRLLSLIQGEIFVTTGGHDAAVPLPPFFVRNRDGNMQAMGTRFQVRQYDQETSLSVYEHAVALHPDTDWQARIVQAGESVRFNQAGILAIAATLPEQSSWRDGILVARRMRLDTFLEELGRYRAGWLHHDPEVAGLLLSGTFSLDNSDLALAAMTEALPVRLERHTRYWVKVVPGRK